MADKAAKTRSHRLDEHIVHVPHIPDPLPPPPEPHEGYVSAQRLRPQKAEERIAHIPEAPVPLPPAPKPHEGYLSGRHPKAREPFYPAADPELTAVFTIAPPAPLANGALTTSSALLTSSTNEGYKAISERYNLVHVAELLVDDNLVSGNVSIVSGAANGLILTANASGTASWAAPLIQMTTITNITATQVQSLSTTPITLLPAPGVGNSHIIQRLRMVLNYGGVGFSTTTPPEVYYGPGTSSQATANFGSALITDIASASQTVLGTSNVLQAAATDNAPIILSATGAITGGTGSTLNIQIWYSIVPTLPT